MIIPKNLLMLSFFLLILSSAAHAKGEWSKYCTSESQLEQLKLFTQEIRQIEQEKRSGGVTSQQVETLLGKPSGKHDKTIQTEEGKEIWLYPHPCLLNVRFLFLFDSGSRLEEIKSVINVSGQDIFYHADRFLPKNLTDNVEDQPADNIQKMTAESGKSDKEHIT